MQDAVYHQGEIARGQWTVPATAIDVSLLRRAAVRFAEGAHVAEPLMHALRLALAEALSNTVNHASAPRAPGSVSVDLAVDRPAGTMNVTVCDDGHGPTAH